MVKKLHNSLRYEKIRVDIDRGDSMPDFIENVRLSDDGKAVVILDRHSSLTGRFTCGWKLPKTYTMRSIF